MSHNGNPKDIHRPKMNLTFQAIMRNHLPLLATFESFMYYIALFPQTKLNIYHFNYYVDFFFLALATYEKAMLKKNVIILT